MLINKSNVEYKPHKIKFSIRQHFHKTNVLLKYLYKKNENKNILSLRPIPSQI